MPVRHIVCVPRRVLTKIVRSFMFVAFLAPLGDASNNADILDRRRGAFFGALVAE